MNPLKTESTISLNDDSPPLTKTTGPYPTLRVARLPAKPVPTKIMMQEAIKAFSTQFRKGFSMDKIRKYLLQNYLHTTNEVKHRLHLMRKYFKSALESGAVESVKGAGLTGSFRVPPTSPLHKNYKQNIRKLNKEQTEKVKEKKRKNEKVAVERAKKVNVKRVFSANM